MDRDRPPVMVPASEESAAMGILIDQFRRMQTTMDKVNDTMNLLGKQMERMDAEAKHMVERRDQNERRLEAHERRFDDCETRNAARFERVEGRVDLLENWKMHVEGGRALLGGILKHPLSTVVFNAIVAILIAALVVIVGKRLGL